jgi:hypothetical protein
MTQHRASLIFYPQKGGRRGAWKIIHTISFHGRVEDAFGELKGWCESAMNGLLKRDAPEKEKTSGTSSVSEKEQDGGSGGFEEAARRVGEVDEEGWE